MEVENFVPTGLRCLEVICWPMPIRTSYRLLLPALLSERASDSSEAAHRLLADRRLERRERRHGAHIKLLLRAH